MKVVGVVVMAVGGVLVLIGFIWGRVVGFYPSEAPALITVLGLGVAGLTVGGLIMKGGGRPQLPAGARMMSDTTPAPVAAQVPGSTRAADTSELEAADPATPLDRLAELAHRDPSLRPAVAANPSAYAGLLDWLGGLGDPDVDAALASRNRPEAGGHESGARARAADPATSPADLADLARLHRDLRPVIAANPSAYDGLRDWIAENP